MTRLNTSRALQSPQPPSGLPRLAAFAVLGASLLLGGCAVVSEGHVSGYPSAYPVAPSVAYPSGPGYGGTMYGGSGYYGGGAVYGAPGYGAGYYPPAAVVVTPRIVTPVVPRPSHAAPVVVPPRAIAPVVVPRPGLPAGPIGLQPGYNPRNPGMSAPAHHGGGVTPSHHGNAVTGAVPAYRPSPGTSLPPSRFGQPSRRSH